MMQLRAESVDDTHAIAAAVAGLARAGDVVVLAGDMGTGKTAFAQGFGKAMGVTEPITSPTFTLVHSYECGKITLHHADLYRLERTTEIADLALLELAEFDGIVLVEWGDVARGSLGDHLEVRLELDDDAGVDDAGDGAPDDDPVEPNDPVEVVVGDEPRIVVIEAVGPTWAGRWSRLAAAVEAYRC